MVDATFSDFSDVRQTRRASGQARLFTKTGGAVGSLVTIVLVSLKLLALAEDRGWSFYADDLALNLTQIELGQWPAVFIILIEALVAGAAVSIVYSYTVNHISQTVQNIWQRLERVGPEPGTLLVDEDTRSWVTTLTARNLKEAQDQVLQKDQDVRRLQADNAALISQIDTLKIEHAARVTELEGKNRTLATKLDDVNKWFAKFQKLAEEIKPLGQQSN